MLALTDNAVEAVKQIVTANDATSESAGLRMVAEPAGGETRFELSVAAVPAEDDAVIDAEGARVFLEPEAASLLDDKVLDVRVEENRIGFVIADQ